MKRIERIAQLKYQMDRYDKYLQVVDIKANILLAYHFFVVGGFLVNYSDIKLIYPVGFISIELFTVVILVTSLFSAILTFTSTYPFLKKGENKQNSLMFFNDVAERSIQAFKQEYKDQGNWELEEDLLCQVHILSQGLSSKFKKIRWAGILCYSHLIMAFSTLIQYFL